MTKHSSNSDKTPILLHPAKRTELLTKGLDLFNDEEFFEAHEAWEALWMVENGRDKTFVQGLIQTAAHLLHLRKGNWRGAKSIAPTAKEKLMTQTVHRLYRELDVLPLSAAIDYNLGVLAKHHLGDERTIGIADSVPPVPDEFLIPKLYEK